MSKQTIGVIGAGTVGLAVGSALQRAGHDVVYGLREGSSSAAEVKSAGGTAVSLREAAQRKLVLLAVPANALPDTVRGLGDLQGRVVIDATNSFGASQGGVALQALVPGAHVVKAFNTTGAENMGDARRLAQAPVMPICGDDAASKELVIGIVRDIGFEAIDAGPLKNAELLESMARLWVSLVRGGMGRDWAFAITRTSTR
jgi:8-hydroxy-5-deazaflavin:NADPH oxidoreductase